jgi:glycosyltransferase involved in cell wall biosynthesis
MRSSDAPARPTKLLVVGRTAWKAGPMFDVYQQMAYRRDVHLTGRVSEEELVQLYAAALATVYVPYFEGFGIPIIEAQACASPVLTSDCSSMPEVAGGAALLADPFRPDSIADALLRLQQEPSCAPSSSAKALQNVQRFFLGCQRRGAVAGYSFQLRSKNEEREVSGGPAEAQPQPLAGHRCLPHRAEA